MGIRVGIEYEPGLLVERAEELAEVITRVGSPLLGANLDIGHAWLASDAPRSTADLLAGRIWNCHVEDIAAGKHFHLVPGDGELPLSDWMAALVRIGYAGFYTVELYTCADAPDTAGARALSHLRKLSAQREVRG